MFIIAEGNEELSVGKDLNSMKGGSWAVTLRLHLIYDTKYYSSSPSSWK
jgi:hypothetical protein